MAVLTHKVDSRGRVMVGKKYANRLMIVQQTEDQIVLIPAEAVPAREAWLFKNPAALRAVVEGLEDAKARRFAEPPDLDADEKLLAAVEDE